MQILGPGLALLSFLGGVFIPLDQGSTLWHIADWTPMFGVAEIARAPLTHELPWYAVVNAVGLAGALRGRRRVADEQGHGAGVTGTTVTHHEHAAPRRRLDRPDGRPGRLGCCSPPIWLFFLLDPLRGGWDAPRTGRAAGVGHARTLAFAAVYMASSACDARRRPQRLRRTPSRLSVPAVLGALSRWRVVMCVCARRGGHGVRGLRRGRRGDAACPSGWPLLAWRSRWSPSGRSAHTLPGWDRGSGLAVRDLRRGAARCSASAS